MNAKMPTVDANKHASTHLMVTDANADKGWNSTLIFTLVMISMNV